MKYNGKNNPRVIIIQKIYSKLINNDLNLNFPKHRYKKFIKDIVNGTLERNEVINNEINLHLKEDIDLRRVDKVFEVILRSAIFELLYKPTTSSNIIIKESSASRLKNGFNRGVGLFTPQFRSGRYKIPCRFFA